MNVRYRVELSQAERCELTAMLSKGKRAARKLKRAQILLAADAGRSDEEIARAVVVGCSTVYRTKRRFVEGNLERALSEDPRPGAERKLTCKEEALLVATACATPPEGRARWTLELLAGAMVKLTDHESLSGETVRRRLAENGLKPWRKDMWCIPKVDGEYVARMEDVLDLYAEAPDPKRPVVCFDESPVQLIGEVRQPIPAEPGQLERYDYEYRRNGTVNLFVCIDVHRPWRKVKAFATLIAKSNRRLIIACGSFAGVGRILAHHAGVAGYRCEFYDDAVATANGLSDVSSDDVVIIITFWRLYNVAITAGRQARERGATVCLLSDAAVSPVAKHAHHSLIVPSEGTSFFPALVPGLSVVEGICAELESVNVERARQGVRNAERQWQDFDLLHFNSRPSNE